MGGDDGGGDVGGDDGGGDVGGDEYFAEPNRFLRPGTADTSAGSNARRIDKMNMNAE